MVGLLRPQNDSPQQVQGAFGSNSNSPDAAAIIACSQKNQLKVRKYSATLGMITLIRTQS